MALMLAPIHAAAQGYWKIEGRGLDQVGSEAKKATRYRWDNWTYSERVPVSSSKTELFSCGLAWASPPNSLVPGKPLEMKFVAQIVQLPSSGSGGCNVSAWLDHKQVPYGSSGYANLFAHASRGGGPNVNSQRRRDEQTGRANVPGKTETGKLYLRIWGGPGAYEYFKGTTYVYAWSPGSPPPGAGTPGAMSSLPSAPSGSSATGAGSSAKAPAASAPAAAAGPTRLFNNWNTASVGDGPKNGTIVTFSSPVTITRIVNYHWNGGRGAAAGTIALRGQNGKVYGPWPTRATPGSGRQNVNWEADISARVPAGQYVVIDSSPSTWSQNPGSGGRGFTQVYGIPQK